MDALKFLNLDLKMMKSQIKVILFYPLMGFLLIFFIMNDMTFIVGYMILGFTIIATMPFSIENTKKNIFYYTLPAKAESMVMGRFLTLLSGAALFTLLCFILIPFSIAKGGVITDLQILYYTIFASVSLIVCLIQYTIFYKLGVIKSQQFFTLVQMLPGILIWLAMSYGSRYVQDKPGELQKILEFGKMHISGVIAIEILLVGFIFYLSYKISSVICRQKEI